MMFATALSVLDSATGLLTGCLRPASPERARRNLGELSLPLPLLFAHGWRIPGRKWADGTVFRRTPAASSVAVVVIIVSGPSRDWPRVVMARGSRVPISMVIDGRIAPSTLVADSASAAPIGKFIPSLFELSLKSSLLLQQLHVLDFLPEELILSSEIPSERARRPIMASWILSSDLLASRGS